jgi:formyl-CoA transferase
MALWNYYRCADGKWLILALLLEDRWPRFCRAMGLDRLVTDPRFESAEKREENSAQLVAMLDDLFAQKPREEWMRILGAEKDLIYGVVNTMDEVIDDPQVKENDYIVDYEHPVFGPVQYFGFPVGLSKTPMAIQREAPGLGQHTEEILLAIGYDRKEIEKLRADAVI